MNSLEFSTYTGGAFVTNAYAIMLPPKAESSRRRCILIDAPEGSAEWLREQNLHVSTLLLTHGHIDHVFDAAAITQEHYCPVFHHEDTLPFLTDRKAYQRFGIPMDLEPVTNGRFLNETPHVEFSGVPFRVLLVPGHCPGSLCFLHEESGNLFSGDTLMAGAVGRWDLPGGNQQQLFSNIRNKLFTLDENVQVHPGHGPSTTVGIERRTNPFFL